MTRRELLGTAIAVVLGPGIAAAHPTAGRPQIGYLSVADGPQRRTSAFIRGLAGAGYREGRIATFIFAGPDST